MSKYIEAEWLESRVRDVTLANGALHGCIDKLELIEAPSIDIVCCGECEFEWTQKCPPHRMGLIHDESDYCSYGIRRNKDARSNITVHK